MKKLKAVTYNPKAYNDILFASR